MRFIATIFIVFGFIVLDPAGNVRAGEDLLARANGEGGIKAEKTTARNAGETGREDASKTDPFSKGLLGMNQRMKRIPELERGINISLWPIYRQYRGPDKHTTTALWPLFEHRKTKSGDSFTYSFPLFWHSSRSDKSGFTSFFPLFFRTWDGKGNGSLAIAPPLFISVKRSESDRQYSFLWPFYGWRLAPERTQIDAFPFFYRRQAKSEIRPYFEDRKDLLGTGFAEPPAFMNEVEADDYCIIFPIFWHFKKGRKTYTHVWPLFGYDRDDRNWRRYSLFTWLYLYETAPEENRFEFFCLLFKYARQEIIDRAGNKKGVVKSYGILPLGLFPVFQYGHSPTSTVNMLFGVYSYQADHRKGEGQLSLFILLHLRHWDRESTTQWYLGPLFRYKRNTAEKSRSYSILALPYTERWHIFGVGGKKDDFFLEFHPLFQYKVEDGLSRFHILYGLFGLYHERPAGKPKAEAARRFRILWFFSF